MLPRQPFLHVWRLTGAFLQQFLQFHNCGSDPVVCFGCGAGPALLAELSVVYARVLVTDSFLNRSLFYDGDLWPLDPVADVFMVLGVENRHWY